MYQQYSDGSIWLPPGDPKFDFTVDSGNTYVALKQYTALPSYGARGCILFFNVTAIAGGPWDFDMLFRNPADGTYQLDTSIPTVTRIAGTTVYVLQVYPGVTDAKSQGIGRLWGFQLNPTAGSPSITLTVGCQLIP